MPTNLKLMDLPPKLVGRGGGKDNDQKGKGLKRVRICGVQKCFFNIGSPIRLKRQRKHERKKKHETKNRVQQNKDTKKRLMCDGSCGVQRNPRAVMISSEEVDNYLQGSDLGLRSAVHPDELQRIDQYSRDKLIDSIAKFRISKAMLSDLSDDMLREFLKARYREDIRNAEKLTRMNFTSELMVRGLQTGKCMRESVEALKKAMKEECRCFVRASPTETDKPENQTDNEKQPEKHPCRHSVKETTSHIRVAPANITT